MELTRAHFKPNFENLKKSLLKKFLCFQEIELYSRKSNFLALILRNFLYFLKRKLSLYFEKWNFLTFQKTETPKKFFIFQETELSYTSGNGTFLYFE